MMTHRLSLAKRRATLRRRGRGAVMFIVAMTLAVLASVGMYALVASSVEIKTSGYGKQAAQTHYLAEYGMLAAAQDLNGTNAQLYLGLMTTASTNDLSCTSLVGAGVSNTNLTKACRRMGSKELAAVWGGTSAVTANVGKWPSGVTTAGSFGPYPQSGDFYIELTDPAQASAPPGYDVKLGLCFAQFTVSSYGITQPVEDTLLDAPLPATGRFGAWGLEQSRGRLTAGPVRCAQ